LHKVIFKQWHKKDQNPGVTSRYFLHLQSPVKTYFISVLRLPDVYSSTVTEIITDLNYMLATDPGA